MAQIAARREARTERQGGTGAAGTDDAAASGQRPELAEL